MANTVTSLSYANTFGHWLNSTDALISENNILAKGNYVKDTGTLFLSESTQNALQANGNIIAQKQLLVQGVGSSATIQNNLTVQGQGLFTNTGLSIATTANANVGGILTVLGSGFGLEVANNARVAGDLVVGGNLELNVLEARLRVNTANISITGTTYTNRLTANGHISSDSLVANTNIFTSRVQANTSITTTSLQANTIINAAAISATTGIFSNTIQANTSVNTATASIMNTLFANVVQANTSTNTANASVTGTVYTKNLIANTTITGLNIFATANVSSNNLYVADSAYVGGNVNVTNTVNTIDVRANTVFSSNITVADTTTTSELVALANIITPEIFSVTSYSDYFEANTDIITPTITVEGTSFTRVLQADSSTNTSNASVTNTLYVKALVANTSAIIPAVFTSGTTTTDVLQANSRIGSALSTISGVSTTGSLQANTSTNTSNASIVNTTYTKHLVANTSVITPTITVSGATVTSTLQANVSTNTQTISVSQLIDGNTATAFLNNLSIGNQLSVSGDFVISGTTVYNSDKFTINAGSNIPEISYFEVNRGTGSTNAHIRWNEPQKLFDVIDVVSNSYYHILTSNLISGSLTSTSSSTIASSAAANTLNNTITAANNFLQAAVVSAGSYANAAFIAANTANTKAVNSGSYANAAFLHANAAFISANNVAPQIEPAFRRANAAFAKANSVIASVTGTSGSVTASDAGVTLGSNNGITINSTSANTLIISTAQDIRTTATPTFAGLDLTTPLPITEGGTGVTSTSAILNAILPSGATNGYVLTTGGVGNYFWAAGTGGGGAGATPGTTISSTRLTYSGDSSNTKFITPTFNNSTQLRAYINGVRQLESEYHANTANSRILFSTAPAVGDSILLEVDGYAVYEYFANNIAYTTNQFLGAANTIQSAIDTLTTSAAFESGAIFVGNVTGLTMNIAASNTSFATTAYVKNVLGSTGTYAISTTGNAGSVTNGVYTSESYANPTFITSLANTKITGVITAGQLASTAVSASSVGSANQVSRFTVDAQGRLTSANSVAISIPISQISNFPTLVASATTDTTSASNITSGTLPDARLSATGVVNAAYGGANKVGTFTVDAKGRITAAADTQITIQKSQVSDFPALATSATTDTTNAGNITSGTLAEARLPASFARLTGAIFTGETTVTDGGGKVRLLPSGDIYAYRSGGATGVVYLNSSGTRYLYNDGTKYYLNGQALDINGSQATTLATGGIVTGGYNFRSSLNVGTAGQSGTLAAYGSGNVGDSASMSFHRPGAYAINMGLDSDNAFRLGGWSNGTNVYRWTSDASGNFVASGNVTAYSDERLKTNIKTIENALDTVSKMRGVTYERIDSGIKGVGVIAQEMKEVLPEVVMEALSDDEYMSVSYGNIVGVLIEAIKELKAEIEELKGQNK